jgi:hypothetical protein
MRHGENARDSTVTVEYIHEVIAERRRSNPTPSRSQNPPEGVMAREFLAE